MLSNNLPLGPYAARDAIEGVNCVVIGDGALADRADLGTNLFHVEGVVSVEINALEWAATVRSVMAELMTSRSAAALEPLFAFTDADLDELRSAIAAALASDPRFAAQPLRWQPPEAPATGDLVPSSLDDLAE
ncbi:hypothetical protein AAG604_10565 [Citromicrobium bathyomarinum]